MRQPEEGQKQAPSPHRAGTRHRKGHTEERWRLRRNVMSFAIITRPPAVVRAAIEILHSYRAGGLSRPAAGNEPRIGEAGLAVRQSGAALVQAHAAAGGFEHGLAS